MLFFRYNSMNKYLHTYLYIYAYFISVCNILYKIKNKKNYCHSNAFLKDPETMSFVVTFDCFPTMVIKY